MIALLTQYAPVLVPLIAALIGWLLPSPIQKARRDKEKIHEAEKKADETRGHMDDLDRLP